jgi:hypothetical protein
MLPPIRTLNPATALVAPGVTLAGPTAYVADRLLVDARTDLAPVTDQLRSVLADLGWTVTVGKAGEVRDSRVAKREFGGFRTLTLGQAADRLASPPDAWIALQHLIAADRSFSSQVHLDHVLTTCPGYWDGIGGYWDGIGGYWEGIGGYWDGIAGSQAPAEFGRPGYGGRAPVSLLIADPALSVERRDWSPRVVMIDTGIGAHPWFPRRDASGQLPPGADPRSEVTVHGTGADDGPGVSDPMTGALDRLAGHGTFIAGIIRQICPAARLVSYGMLGSTGIIVESDLLARLRQLVDDQHDALARKDRTALIDVLSLSIGYYHEKPEDDLTDTLLAAVLRDLGRVGVAVIAGAGNDATTRPLLPAGFAAAPPYDGLPVLSVASLNPNRADVSLFSNDGPWVTHHRRGAAVVSTLPVAQNASGQESTWTRGHGDRPRATLDRDDYRGGFGTWSGTSFATPVLAGEVALAMLSAGEVPVDAASLVERGRKVIENLTSFEGDLP